MAKIKLIVLLSFISTISYSQTLQQIRLFSAKDSMGIISSQYIEFNNRLYFISTSSLWVTDGSETGTQKVMSFYGTANPYNRAISDLTVVNGKLLFFADDGIHNWELWSSDGTAQGTKMVKDINPVGRGCYIRNIYDDRCSYPMPTINNEVFFLGNDGINGIELWKSDGTAIGTKMVKNINTVPGQGIASDTQYVHRMVAINNGLLFFEATDTSYGTEIWISDGTSPGTKILKDLNPSKAPDAPLYPKHIVQINNKVYFNRFEGIYYTDGTPSGTQLIAETTILTTNDIIEYNNFTYLNVHNNIQNKIIKTDGTKQGTTDVTNVVNNNIMSSSLTNLHFQILNNRLYFILRDSFQNDHYLCEIDGQQKNKIYPIKDGGYELFKFNQKLYFKEVDYNNDHINIMESDGSTTGTQPIIHSFINVSVVSVFIRQSILRATFAEYNGNLLFCHRFNTPDYHFGLYKYGTPNSIAPKVNLTGQQYLYPNPANDYIVINVPIMSDICIVSITGKVMHHNKNCNQKESINITDWPTGIYVATITGSNGTVTTQKLIKE